MTRRTFNLASFASLLACALLVMIWIGTGRSPRTFQFGRQDARWDLRSLDGVVAVSNRPQLLADLRVYRTAFDQFVRQRTELAEERRQNVAFYADAKYGSPEWREFLAAQQRYLDENFKLVAPPRNIRPSQVYSVRHRTLVLAAAVLPALWLIADARRRYDARRARSAGLHLCRACGYDLRATPDRCPECGTPALRGRAA